MRFLTGLWFFYLRLLLPALILSGILGAYAPAEILNFSAGAGLSFLFVLPMFHYFIYEINNPQEYYFYHNLGLSKVFLWTFTIISSSIFSLILFQL